MNILLCILCAFASGYILAEEPQVLRQGESLSIAFSNEVLGWALRTESGEVCARSDFNFKPVTEILLDRVSMADNLVLDYSTAAGENGLFIDSERQISRLKKPTRAVTIYQLPVRTYLAKGEGPDSAGKFSDLSNQILDELVDGGYDYLWLTGILQQASPKNTDPDVVKGNAGSYYAITDNWSVSSDLGSMDEFLGVVDLAHKRGLRVIMDLVVNHTARFHQTSVLCKQPVDLGANDDTTQSFDAANNYFYLDRSVGEFIPPLQPNAPGADGVFDVRPFEAGIQFELPARVTGNDVKTNEPNINDWFETAKLNYGYDFATGKKQYYPIPNTWSQIVNIAEYWLRLGIDGFRVDFAHAVPLEFWRYFVDNLRNVNSEVFLLAEAYETDFAMKVPEFSYEALLDAGFDSIYNSEFYWDLRKLVDVRRPPIMANYSRSPAMRREIQRKGYRFTNYLENHDEVRVASDRFAPNIHSRAARAKLGYSFAVYSALLPGNFMVHGGQEFMEDAQVSGEFEPYNGKTSIFDFVHQEQTLMARTGSAEPYVYDFASSYASLIRLKQISPFSTSHSLDVPSFIDLEFANHAGGRGQWLGVYARFFDEQRYIVVFNSDPVSAHEVTVHFTNQDGRDASGALGKLGVENSSKKYLFVEVLNRPGWVPQDPNIVGVGIPGWALYRAGNVPSGLYLGKIPAGTAYVFKVVEF